MASADDAQAAVQAFLKAQDDRDLDAMCQCVTDDIVYINEPLPPERQIRGKEMFCKVFAMSPCIWAEEAHLRVLNMSASPGLVFTEREDSFLIEGKWLRIPICGRFNVDDQGLIREWKDYWDYKSYEQRKLDLFGEGFSLFRKPE
mmetsp:Transcript_128727/g.293895  ORF Transcript_128727/g.293895 Transcript_128727/m.293895 type:complete len:145 (-) Transcript_128727:44-478(-)